MELKAKINGVWRNVTYKQVEELRRYEEVALASAYKVLREEWEASNPVDRDLEDAIDEAGRDNVVALMRSYGWSGPQPKWMWWEAVRVVSAQDNPQRGQGAGDQAADAE